MVVNPDERMNCDQALKHIWLTSAANTSVLENVKKFNAKKTFKKAIQAVTAANQLKQLGVKKDDLDTPNKNSNRDSYATATGGEE